MKNFFISIITSILFTKCPLLAMDSPVEIEKINIINKIGQPSSVGNFNYIGNCPSNYSRHVQQHFVGYTNDRFPIIGSCAADCGVIMAVHNPEIRLAALCFVDQVTDLSSLDIIFDTLATTHNCNLDIHLVGGNGSDRASTHLVYEIIQKIGMRENLSIKSADLLNSPHVSSRFSIYGKRLAIDARTGSVFTHFDRFAGSPLDTSYDSYKNLSFLLTEQDLRPDSSLYEKHMALNKLMAEQLEKINTINKIGQPRSVGNFDSVKKFPSNHAGNVQQRYVGYTNHNYQYIGSCSAFNCVIMAAYNPEIQVAALCHVDVMTNLSSLDAIFDNLTRGTNCNLDVHLVGGEANDRASTHMVYDIIQKIEMRKNISIKSAALLEPVQHNHKPIAGKGQLAIDSLTGLVYTHFDKFNGSGINHCNYLICGDENKVPLLVEQGLEPALSFQ